MEIRSGIVIQSSFFPEPVKIEKVEAVRFIVPVNEWKWKGRVGRV
jgi:hypothetical protein